MPWRYRAAKTIQTWPRANVIGWPEAVLNVVPPSALGRAQCACHSLPSRNTSAEPDPVLSA
jgi:hypothetical protein